MRGDVGDGGPADPRGGVVPPVLAARRMVAAVEAVSGHAREVDAADERRMAVDHDQLLVMTVHRTFLAVGGRADARPVRQPVEVVVDVAPRRPEERERRPGPRKDAHVHALRGVGEQLT